MSFFLGAKLSVFLCWCQIVLVPNCPFLLCWCHIVLVPNGPVPNGPVPNCPLPNYPTTPNLCHCNVSIFVHNPLCALWKSRKLPGGRPRSLDWHGQVLPPTEGLQLPAVRKNQCLDLRLCWVVHLLEEESLVETWQALMTRFGIFAWVWSGCCYQ